MEVATLSIRVDSSQVKTAERSLSRLERRAQSVQKRFRRFGQSAVRAGSMFAIGLTLPITLLSGAAVVAAAKMETLRNQLNVLTGDIKEGGRAFQLFSQYAFETPFALNDVIKAGRRLVTVLGDVDRANEVLRDLGDIAAIANVPLNDMAAILAQVETKGQLMTEELRQFGERGVPMFQILANSMGITKQQVQELVTAGKLGFNDLAAAIAFATSEGGMFYQGALTASQTLTGRFSNLTGALFETGAAWGEMVSEVLNLKGVMLGLTGALGSLTEWFKSLNESQRQTLVTVTALTAAIPLAILAIGAMSLAISSGLIPVVVAAVSAFETLYVAMLLNPAVAGIVAVTAVIAGLGYAAYNAYQSAQRLNDQVQKLVNVNVSNKSWQDLENHVSNIKDKMAFLVEDATILVDGIPYAPDRNKHWKELNKQLQIVKEHLEAIKPMVPFSPMKPAPMIMDEMGLSLGDIIRGDNIDEGPFIFRPKVEVIPEVKEEKSGGVSEAVQKIMDDFQKRIDVIGAKMKLPAIFDIDPAKAKMEEYANMIEWLLSNTDLSVHGQIIQNLVDKWYQTKKNADDYIKSLKSVSTVDIAPAGMVTPVELQFVSGPISKEEQIRNKIQGLKNNAFLNVAVPTAVNEQIDKLQGKLKGTADAARELDFAFESAFEDAIIQGKAFGDILLSLLQDIQRMILRTQVLAPIMDALFDRGDGKGLISEFIDNVNLGSLFGGNSTSVEDALITSGGDVVKFHPDDNILAMKDFGGMGGTTVNVNVVNKNGSQVDVQQQQKPNGEIDIGVIVDNQWKQSAQQGKYDNEFAMYGSRRQAN